MGELDKDKGVKKGLSRREFLQAGAAAAAVGAAGLDFAAVPSTAAAADVAATYHTTCPYCSASCGQLVDVDADGNVLDVYGDHRSVFNGGGLCAKGAGAFQLVTNSRRVGAFTGTHPVNPVFAAQASTTAFSAVPTGWTGATYTPSSYTYAGGVAYWRLGNGSWYPVPLDVAMADIATKMRTARGIVAGANQLNSLYTAGDTVDGVVYTGFSGLATIKKADGNYFVTTNGNKVDQATLLTLLAGLPGTAAALVAAFDGLVFTAVDPVDKAGYSFVGRSDLGTKMLAAGVFANTGDFVRDGSTYYAYLVDAVTGNMHVATSPDMLVWTYGSDLGKPAGVGTMTSPTVLKSGSTLKVWYVDIVAQKLQYASYDGTVWSAATNVTVGGSEPIWFVGHPLVTSDGTNYTLYYVLGSGGIKKATAPVATPAVFGAASSVYDDIAKSEGNIAIGNTGIAFTTYAQPDPTDTGWAYSDIKSYFFANAYNSKGVAFLGSSHINNEQNYLYRKIIANFGTSNTEHQARI